MQVKSPVWNLKDFSKAQNCSSVFCEALRKKTLCDIIKQPENNLKLNLISNLSVFVS